MQQAATRMRLYEGFAPVAIAMMGLGRLRRGTISKNENLACCS